MFTFVKRCLHALGILFVIAGAAEVSARIDDWVHQDIPLGANPNRQHDLVKAELWGYHGRPGGQYLKWKLNQFGFRGPDMAREPPSFVARVMILGASETFGLYESPGKEYPAQLRELLAQGGAFEIVNGAMAGMTVKSMSSYWANWAGQFGAKVIVIYPTPIFYLGNEAPSLPNQPTDAPASFQFRIIQRIREAYQTPPTWTITLRENWSLQRVRSGKGPEWYFQGPPKDRRQAFENDLAELIEQARAGGAKVILATHALNAKLPLDAEDEALVRRNLMFYARATPTNLVEFERLANDSIRALAKRENVGLLDVEQVMTGQRQYFADLVHFNDAGAGKMAELLATAIQKQR